VRVIFEDAEKLGLYVPRELVFFDLAVKGSKRHRNGLDGLRNALQSKKADTLLLFATNRLFRKVDHIHAAHEGLLEKRMVFGTLSFGYAGEVIPGAFTNGNNPRRRIIIDEDEAVIVRQIFRWYVDDNRCVSQIIQDLNADTNTPLPPHARTGQ
jgi:hypothetical protein